MHKQHKPTAKIISLTLTLAMLCETVSGAGVVLPKDTLQAPTLFTGSKQDAPQLSNLDISLITRYFSNQFKQLEEDRRNLNVMRLKCAIGLKLRALEKLPRLPDKIKKAIPNIVEIDHETRAVIVDFGPCAIRYFNPAIDGSEVPSGEWAGKDKIVRPTRGRYLTKQILIPGAHGIPDGKKTENETVIQHEKSTYQSRKTSVRKKSKKKASHAPVSSYEQRFINARKCLDKAHMFFNSGKRKQALKKVEEGLKLLTGMSIKYEKVVRLKNSLRGAYDMIKGGIMAPKFQSIKRRKRKKCKKSGSAKKPEPGKPFGPALFIDPDTGNLRELSDEYDASGGMTEHKAVNDSYRELIFDRHREPLESGDPVYDFFQDGFSRRVTMYKYNEDEMEEKLAQKGYPRIAEGLITHAGTYHAPETGEERANNIFIPEFVYELFLELLERKFEMNPAYQLLLFWREHECVHLLKRDYLRDDRRKNMANCILALAKALRAFKKREFDQAIAYVNEIIKKASIFAFPYELRGRIYEAQGNYQDAGDSYIDALAEINRQKIIHMHPLENKILNMILLNPRSEKTFFKRFKKVNSDSAKFKTPVSGNLITGLFTLCDPEYKSFGSDWGFDTDITDENLQTTLFLSVIPIACAYLDRALNYRPKVTTPEMEVVEKLLDVVSGDKISDFEKENKLNISGDILARVYYTIGKVYKKKSDYSRALEYFDRSISCREIFPDVYAQKASILMNQGRSPGDFKKAEDILKKAEEKFGQLDIFTGIKAKIQKKEDELNAEKKREKELEGIYSTAKILFEDSKYHKCLDLLSGAVQKAHGTRFYNTLKELKNKAYSIIKLKKRAITCFRQKSYKEAGELFMRILEKNPCDFEIIGLDGRLFDILEDKKWKDVERDELLIYAQQVQRLCETAGQQILSGRIGKARKNYTDALKILSDAPLAETIQELKREIEEKLAKIQDLPDVVERQKKDKPETPVKKKKETRFPKTEIKEKDTEVSPGDAEDSILEKSKKEVRFSDQAANMLWKLERREQNAILEDIKHTAAGRTENVDIRKIESVKGFYRIRKGEYRAITTITSGVMLICAVDTKPRTHYNKITSNFSGRNTQIRILENAITLEDLEEYLENSGRSVKGKKKKRKKRAMKAPGSLSPDEDERVDLKYIDGLLSKAKERTGEANITEAARYINRHAPPLRGKKIDPSKIKIFTVPLGDKPGIPRFEGAKKAEDLLYVEGRFRKGILKVYVTDRYFDLYLKGYVTSQCFDLHFKDNVCALAEAIDHEYTEKVLGYSHRVAASRSCKFVSKDRFISPFHYFYVDQVMRERNYSLSRAVNPARLVSRDIVKAYGADNKKSLKEIEAYEKRFFDYLRLMEWLSKAKDEKDPNVLAECSLRIYKILERYPRLKLDSGRQEIFKKIENARFYPHEFEKAKKVYHPLSEFSWESLDKKREDVIFTGNMLDSNGKFNVKGQRKPLVRISAYPQKRVAFSVKNGDIYKIWVLDNENKVIGFRQMGQIYEPDGRFRERFYFGITKSKFDSLGDCTIEDYRLNAEGMLIIGRRKAQFGAYYANCKVKIKVCSGQIDTVWIYDEYGRKIKKAEFALIYEKATFPGEKTRLTGSFYSNLTEQDRAKCDNVTIKRVRLSPDAALFLGGKGKGDPTPFFEGFPNAAVEVDMLNGHVDKVRILDENGETVEEHIFKLIYDSEEKVICSFKDRMLEKDFRKKTGRVTRLRSDKKSGWLKAGAVLLGVFKDLRDLPAEADVERGIPKIVCFYKDVEKRELAHDPIKYSLIYEDNGQDEPRIIDSFRRVYSKQQRKSLAKRMILKKIENKPHKAVVKEFYIDNDSGVLEWGGRPWGELGKKYAHRKAEFDVINGIVTEVRIFDKKEEKIEKTFSFTLEYKYSPKGEKRVVDSFLDDARSFPWGAEEIKENAKYIIPRLVQSMIDVADPFTEKPGQVILYLDEALGMGAESEVEAEMEQLIRKLTGIEGNNEDLLLFLKDKLVIRSGTAEEFISKKGTIKAENIIVVTNKAGFDGGYFSSIEGRGIITAINDTEFPKNVLDPAAGTYKSAYFPLLQVSFFALGKYLGWDGERLRKYYRKIPNTAAINALTQEEYDSLFKEDIRNIIIRLIPDAVVFDTNEHVELLECVREILSKA